MVRLVLRQEQCRGRAVIKRGIIIIPDRIGTITGDTQLRLVVAPLAVPHKSFHE